MGVVRQGIFLCVIGPSGSGKTSHCRHLLADFPGRIFPSISVTTRPPRSGEQNGVDYFFLTQQEFEKERTAGLLFECEEYSGHWYGTRLSNLDEVFSRGQDLLLPIDVRGALHYKKVYPNETVIVFLLPPSPEVLRERLEARGPMKIDEFERRTLRMHTELEQLLPEHRKNERAPATNAVDYLLINDDFQQTYEALRSIYTAETKRLRRIPLDQLEEWVAQWGRR